MMVVLATMIVITMMLVTALYVVLGNAAPSRRSEDDRAAYAAAQAGIDEYIARLNSTSGDYWRVGNNDPKNPALTATGQGQRIPGAGALAASYRYQLLNVSQIAQTGVIRLQVTGISGPGQDGKRTVQRTLTATLKPLGFNNFVYFSDIEVVDPSLSKTPVVLVDVNGSSGPSGSERYAIPAMDACSLRYYEGRSGSFQISATTAPVGVWDTAQSTWIQPPGSISSGTVTNLFCAEIRWADNDIVNGGLHSNDALWVDGAVTFTTFAESSWPYCQVNPTANCWWGTGTPVAPVKPHYADRLDLPVSNSELKTIAQDNTLGVGCYYTGATRIVVTGSQMQVYSPNTTSAPARCLNTANRFSPQTVKLPSVIYVDEMSGGCISAGYPKVGESTTIGVTTDYNCNRGTVMIQGKVDGQVTVAALDDIVITADLTYAGGLKGDDVTGLVAGNFIWVYHPVDSNGRNLLESDPTVKGVYNIDASILSLRHSFLVQNWGRGSFMTTSLSTRLNVTGSIAQKFRGPVGTSGGTGYTKNYNYDPRLQYMQPPYFLRPTSSPWRVAELVDG